MSIAPRRMPPPERFATVLAAVSLLGATVFFVLLTIDLAAAASGSDYSPWSLLGIPAEPGKRIVLLLVCVVVGVLLAVAGLRLRDPLLSVRVPGGEVTVRASSIEQALNRALAGEPDVLRVTATVRSRHGELEADVEVLARPLADTVRLRDEALARLQEALCEAAGLTCSQPQVSVRAVSTGELARYL